MKLLLCGYGFMFAPFIAAFMWPEIGFTIAHFVIFLLGVINLISSYLIGPSNGKSKSNSSADSYYHSGSSCDDGGDGD